MSIVQQNALNFSLIYCANRIAGDVGTVLLQNITASAQTVIGTNNNGGSFVCLAFGTGNSEVDGVLILDNCDNYANIDVTGYAGVFLGGYNSNGYVTYRNCENYGTITGEKVGLFTGNSWTTTTDYASARVSIENCYNYGKMNGTVSCSAFASNNKATDLGYTEEQKAFNAANNGTSGVNANVGSMSIGETVQVGLVKDSENGTVKIVSNTETGIASYEIRVFAQNSFTRADGSNGGSGYVQLVVTGDKNITLPLISKMVSSAGQSVEIPETANRDVYSSSRYVLVANDDGTKTMVVNEQDMIDWFADETVTRVTLNSASRYTVVAKDASGTAISAATYTFDQLQ